MTKKFRKISAWEEFFSQCCEMLRRPGSNLSIFVLFLDIAVSVYYFPPTEEEDDEDGPTMKEKLVELTFKGIDIFCVWDCCWCWLKLQEWISWVVFDPFVELFITLCIVINTMFMAMDHHNMNRQVEKVLKSGNYVRSYCNERRTRTRR